MKLPSRGIIGELVLFKQYTLVRAYMAWASVGRWNSSENQIKLCNVRKHYREMCVNKCCIVGSIFSRKYKKFMFENKVEFEGIPIQIVDC